MRRASVMRAPRVRSWAFAICAVCTLWLVIQNAVLFSVVGLERLPLPAPMVHLTQAMMIGAELSTIALLAFVLGWMASRRAPRTLEGSHE